MNEENIISTLAQLGVDIDDLTDHTDQEGTLWINSYCPLAEWTHTSGTSSNHSFGVSVDEHDNSVYSCFSCGNKGVLSTLARQLAVYKKDDSLNKVSTQITLLEAIKQKPSWDEIQRKKSARVPTKPKPISEDDFSSFKAVESAPMAFNYLARRGVSKNTAKLLELRYDDFRKRILTPLRGVEGKLYGYQGRTVLATKDYPKLVDKKTGRKINYPKTMNSKGLKKELHVLGANRLKNSDKPILVIESPMAYALLIENNVEQYFRVACILGSHLSDTQASLIIKHSNNKPVVLMLDLDEAGEKGLFGVKQNDGTRKGGAVNKLKPHVRVIVPNYPNEKEDIDDFTETDIKTVYDKYF